MLAGCQILVVASPWVFGQFLDVSAALPVRGVGRARRLFHQGAQALIGARVGKIVKLVEIECGAERLHIGLGFRDPSLVDFAEELRHDNRGQDRKDHQHDENFDQGKTLGTETRHGEVVSVATARDDTRMNEQWMRRDLSVLWHPCTQMQDHETLPLIPIARGDGVWLYDHDGRRYLDAVSSWWVNLFGHGNPVIKAAIREQMDRLEHVIFAGFSHPPAITLAERLLAVAPPGLGKVFLADNGSAAVEVALKMSFHAHKLGGSERPMFVALTNSYHGETLGALSVGDLGLYRELYEPLLLKPRFAPSPDAYLAEPGESAEDCAVRAALALRAIFEQDGNRIAALILEPLVQCAGGMRMFHPRYLVEARKLCDEFGVHLIADEIAVGFGRTGTLFACEQARITPDFLCLSKGITGGFMPLSAVLTRNSIFDVFYDRYDTRKAFLHSHSYTGNPLACAAANAVLDLFEAEPVLERVNSLGQHLEHRLAPLRAHPNVADVRRTGLIAAVELVQDRSTRTPFPWQERRGLQVYRYGLEHEMLLRPLGNVIYFMPPYVITESQIDDMVAVASEGIERAVR